MAAPLKRRCSRWTTSCRPAGADLLPGGEKSPASPVAVSAIKKWHSGFIKLAAKYRAPLLPAWINARNSALFYASTLVSDNLPLLLLMQQMFRRRNSSLPVRIGQQIPGRAGSMPSPALASLPAAAISTLNNCARAAGAVQNRKRHRPSGRPGIAQTRTA